MFDIPDEDYDGEDIDYELRGTFWRWYTGILLALFVTSLAIAIWVYNNDAIRSPQ